MVTMGIDARKRIQMSRSEGLIRYLDGSALGSELGERALGTTATSLGLWCGQNTLAHNNNGRRRTVSAVTPITAEPTPPRNAHHARDSACTCGSPI